ncbi:FAD/NAD(P)-binding protein [Zhihengliuella halotolerans]|uniref:FAD/NAD(P)-binding protein n=1 Tax=Zhihengliuella halotolerans TaxID=370736 RepID=UPI000C7F9A52|nr:FAD/NAD(P)-binding domain-containing protein [Zhihengliuella halotolerans]
MNAPDVRVAVVGAGPKALFALQELHERLPSDARASVDVFDPAPPGGAVWDPELPAVLRLNAPAAMVDARFSGFGETLSEWITRTHPAHAGESFPPRRIVGEYLGLAFDRLARSPRLDLRHHRRRIDGLGAGPGLLDADAFDEVLLCTGHAGPGSRLPEAVAAAEAGGCVDVRGAALTGLDAVLMLTEGRGGRWSRIPGDRLGLLAYEPSGAEPARIRLVSRTGAVLSPKPERRHPELGPVIDAATERIRAWATAMPGTPAGAVRPASPVSLDPLWRVLLGAAAEAAAVFGVATTGLRLWRTLLTGRPERDAEVWAGRRQAEFLRQRLEIDAGLRRPDEAWILGRLWQGLYREMVRALDRVPRTARDQRRFRAAAACQERSAFGPPAETVRKLLALVSAGIVEIRAGKPAGEFVDAVTTGPGVLRQPVPTAPEPARTPAPALQVSVTDFHDRLYADLHARGLISVRPGERGLLTDTDAACLRPDGRRTEWLACLGRPTEDPVLGHDTLDRTLHADGRRWAAAVVERLARPHNPRRNPQKEQARA